MKAVPAHGFRVLLLASAGVFSVGEAEAQTLGRSESVAATGQALPSGGGAGSLSTFNAPVINEAGTVAFGSVLAGTSGGAANDTAILVRTAAGVTRFAGREGQVLTGIGTVTSLNTTIPQLNDRDTVLFLNTLSGTSAGSLNDTAILRLLSTDATSRVLLREGASLFGGELSSVNQFSLTPEGSALVGTSLRNTSGGSLDDSGIFISGSSVDQILREGSPTPAGGIYTGLNTLFGRSGELVAVSSGIAGVPGLNSAIFRVTIDISVEVAREGETAPGGGTFASLSSVVPAVNAAGQVAFLAGLNATPNGEADNTGIFRSDGSSTVTLFRKGQFAPKGGGFFNSLGIPQLNSRGQVASIVFLTGTPRGFADDGAVYLSSGGSPIELVREGNPVPGGDGEFGFFTLSYSFTDAGFIAFAMDIRNAPSSAVDFGIYLADGVDTITVAREGDAFAGSTIVSLTLRNSGSPTDSPVNESGQVAYRALLANGQQHIVVFTPDLRYRSTASGTWDTASRWTLGIQPNALHDVAIDPAVSLTVTGPVNPVTVRSLTVGGANGIATLSLAGGTLTATNGVSVASTGVITGDGVINSVVENSGTIRAQNLTINGILANEGLITGNGRLTSVLQNSDAGQIRVEAGQHLILNTPAGQSLSNAGQIDVLGTPDNPAEFETKVQLTNVQNTGLIAARNAILRFDPVLSNSGSLAISAGASDVFGDINNLSTGRVTITGGAVATFYGDVTQNGILRVATVGNTRSVAVFLGGFTGSGGATGGGDIFFEGDLRPGNSPAFVNFDANVSFGPGVTTFIELGGLGAGQYDRITVDGVLSVDGVLEVSLLPGYLPAPGSPVSFTVLSATALVGDFEQIVLPTLPGRDWMIQRTATTLTISSFNVIPEPGMLGAVVPLAILTRRRRR